MKFPLEKYRYSSYELPDGKTKVIAESSYRGNRVRGYAICSPEDNFNLELGKKLAAMRCNEKIQVKKMRALSKDIELCTNEIEACSNYVLQMRKKYNDIFTEYQKDCEDLETLELSLY